MPDDVNVNVKRFSIHTYRYTCPLSSMISTTVSTMLLMLLCFLKKFPDSGKIQDPLHYVIIRSYPYLHFVYYRIHTKTQKHYVIIRSYPYLHFVPSKNRSYNHTIVCSTSNHQARKLKIEPQPYKSFLSSNTFLLTHSIGL